MDNEEQLKECNKCHDLLPLRCFSKQAKRADGLFPACKICNAILRRRWYLVHSEERKVFSKEYALKYPERIKEYNATNDKKRKGHVDELKIQAGATCSKCGYNRCLGALHFHHPVGSLKTKPAHVIIRKQFQTREELEEINRCVLLCANCHAELHATEGYLCNVA